MSQTEIAVLLERIEHVSQKIDELKPLATVAITLQRDHEHIRQDVQHLKHIADTRIAAMHAIDKRVVVLERWHKFMIAIPAFFLTILLTFGGYAKSYLEALEDFKDDVSNRLTSMEVVISQKIPYPTTAERGQPRTEGRK